MKNMNKAGKIAPLVTVLIVFAILALLVISFFVVKNAVLAPPATPGAGGSTTDCNVAPSLGFSVVNGLVKGTGVTVIESVRLNGVLQTPGNVPTAFQYGDEVEIFYNASDYIDVIGPKHLMTCGKNTLNQEILQSTSDNPSIKIFNTDGNKVGDFIQAACLVSTVVNQSESASAINMKMEIQSSPLETSGDLVVVIEVANNTEVGFSDITLSGVGVTDATVPSFYVVNDTISVVRAFNVPASYNGALTTYYINLNPKTGMTIGATAAGEGGTYALVTTYAKQAFIDTDGAFQIGIENKNGVAQYENTIDHGICITG